MSKTIFNVTINKEIYMTEDQDTIFSIPEGSKYISTLAVDTGYYDDATPPPVVYFHDIELDDKSKIIDLLQMSYTLRMLFLDEKNFVEKAEESKDVQEVIDVIEENYCFDNTFIDLNFMNIKSDYNARTITAEFKDFILIVKILN